MRFANYPRLPHEKMFTDKIKENPYKIDTFFVSFEI